MKSPSTDWVLYGATGVTGRIVLEEALKRGHRPSLAGRDPARLRALADPSGLRFAPADLRDQAGLRAILDAAPLVLNAAGPYALTGRPVLDAALATSTAYLDLDGELAFLRELLGRDEAAKEARIPLIGGVGFGVVAGECLGRHVIDRVPDADWLRVSVAVASAHSSPAVSESTTSVLGGGGFRWEHGRWIRTALADRRWVENRGEGQCLSFASAPLAELAALRHSTGVPTITAGIPMSGSSALALQILSPVLPSLLRLSPVRRAFGKAGGHANSAASEAYHSHVWATAGNREGHSASSRLDAGEGYSFAARAAISALEIALSGIPAGAHTPVTAFGVGFLDRVGETSIVDLS